jgi:transcriptional regulator with XRE-family HTH domain
MKKIIGNNIKLLRQKNGLNQKKLGIILGHVPNTTVSSWETGQSVPDEKTLVAIADYFQVALDEIFGRKSPDLPDLPKWLKQLIPDLVTLNGPGQEAVKALVFGLKRASQGP